MEKGTIISKINIKDYNKILEQVLVNKTFSEDTKNLLLNMLYKVENGYSDYNKVKVNVSDKKDILEETIALIGECKEINIIKPTVEDEDLRECSIDSILKKIEAFPNETTLLYSLYRLNTDRFKIGEQYELIKPSVERMLSIGRAISISEVVRDFDGWTWNIDKQKIQDIFINFIYQILNFLVNVEQVDQENTIEILEEKIISISDELITSQFLKKCFQLSIISNIINNKQERTRLIEEYEKIKKKLVNISNKKKYLEEITRKKRQIQNKLADVDFLLNDDMLLKKEYIETNKKLTAEKRIFSLSDFSEIQELKREELLHQLEEYNKKQDPINYIKEKTRIRR